MTVLEHSPLPRPVAWRRSSSPIGLGYRRYASTHPLNALHLAPSNGALAPAWALRMRAPPKFSIKAVHTAARGSLLVSRWLSHIQNLKPAHWSWALPSASYKLLKNITSLLFLSAELGRQPRGRCRTRERLS